MRCYADVPNRFIAFVLDVVVVSIVVFVGAVVLSAVFGPVVHYHPGARHLDERITVNDARALTDSVMSVVVSAAYFVVPWSRGRGTLGQRLLGLEVGSASGAPLGTRRAAVRWLVLLAPLSVAGIIWAVSPVGAAALLAATALWYLGIASTTARGAEKRGMHDRIAGTVVTKSAVPVRE